MAETPTGSKTLAERMAAYKKSTEEAPSGTGSPDKIAITGRVTGSFKDKLAAQKAAAALGADPKDLTATIVEGKPVFPTGVRAMTVQKDQQYFCEFAATYGFRDCGFLRQINPHLEKKPVLDKGDEVGIPEVRLKTTDSGSETTVKSKRAEFPPAFIRVLGATVASLNGGDANTRHKASMQRIGISNFITDKGLNTYDNSTHYISAKFDLYKDKGANPPDSMEEKESRTFADPDHFRIEVYDVSASKPDHKTKTEIEVELQVLQPVYKRKTVANKDEIHRDADFLDTTVDEAERAPKSFKIPKNADRKMKVKCYRVKTSNVFRSKYLRLTTYTKDKLADHTLYVGDYYDEDTLTDDERRYTEILGQRIRVRHTPLMCKPGKCRAQKVPAVGEMKSEMRLALHVYDNCSTNEDVRRNVYGEVRRTYAPCGVRPHLKTIVHHPPIDNVIILGTPAGSGFPASATTEDPSSVTGPSSGTRSKLKVKIDGVDIGVHNFRPFNVDTVGAVAPRLTKLIHAEKDNTTQKFYTDVKTLKTKTNLDLSKKEQNTQVIFVYKDAACTQPVKVDSVTCDDFVFKASNPQMTSVKLGQVSHGLASFDQQILRIVSDTDWIDVSVIKNFLPGLNGIACWMFQSHWMGPNVILISTVFNDTPYNKATTLAHELGHAVMNCGHLRWSVDDDQLMKASYGGEDNGAMDGAHRIQDLPLMQQYNGLYKANGDVMGPWLGPGEEKGSAERCHMFLTTVRQCMGAPTTRIAETEW